MRRRALGTALAAMLLCAGAARAQSTPDLAGTWTLDQAKSDPEPAARGAAAGRGGAPVTQLLITQTPGEVAVRQGSVNMSYKTDGTETFYFQQGEVRATAKWEGDKLVVSWKREFYAGPKEGYVTTTGKDTYSVSAGTLTVDKSTTTPQGTTMRKAVYSKG